MKAINILYFASAVIAAALPNSGTALSARAPTVAPKKVVVYYNTKYKQWDKKPYTGYISPTPLAGSATHVMLSTFRLVPEADPFLPISLNLLALDDEVFDQMWKDLATLQSSGVKVMAMMAGWTQGTWNNLAADFETHYKPLHDMLKDRKMDGIDLDLEQDKNFGLNDMVKLINRLRDDFGDDFIISCAPIPAAFNSDQTLSGPFKYSDLHKAVGDKIDFYNYQFYGGGGNIGVDEFMALWNATIAAGVPGEKIVMGVTTEEGAGGYLDYNQVFKTVVPEVRKQTKDNFGGMMAWEYYGSVPDVNKPELWAQSAKSVLNSPLS